MSPTRVELCVGAVAQRAGRLLLVRRGTEPGRGRWSVPGGRVEPGELLVQAVVRELREETGLEGVCGALLGWVERIGDAHHFVIMDFAVTVLDDDEPTPGDDADDARWVPVDELSDLPLVDGLLEFLADHGIVATRC
jgi:8-oxo-dGTP diphosphatase